MELHKDWLLTPYRAAVHLPSGTGVIADVHLGYDAVRRRTGEAVPALGGSSIRRRLAALLRCHRLARLVVAGDLVESAACRQEAVALIAWLGEKKVEVALVSGNHDRGLPPIAGLIMHFDKVRLGNWCVVHEEDAALGAAQIMGHCHPMLRARGLTGRAACYLVSRRRIILPAFSDDAAGLNVLAAPEWREYDCHAIVGRKVVALGPVRGLQTRLGRMSQAAGRVREPRGSAKR